MVCISEQAENDSGIGSSYGGEIACSSDGVFEGQNVFSLEVRPKAVLEQWDGELLDDEWDNIFTIANRCMWRRERRELRRVSSKWHVFMVEDLCMDSFEVFEVFAKQGLTVWHGFEWEAEWDYLLGETRKVVWHQKGMFMPWLSDRWSSVCSDIIRSLKEDVWVTI